MAEQFTPPTGAIRRAWIDAHPFRASTPKEERDAEFDRWLSQHDAELRAEVERLRDINRQLVRDFNDLAQHDAESEQQVTDLRAGIAALATEGEAWGRGVAVELSKRLRALLAGSGECPECGDATCWCCGIDWTAPASSDSADVRERAIEAGVKAVKASPHGRWLVMPGPVSIQRQVATLIADAVLAVVGQGVTDCNCGFGGQHDPANPRCRANRADDEERGE